MYIHNRPTPPEWQESLEQVVPRRGDLSYLKIVWEPGEEWDPVQRWMIYQMMPVGRTGEDDLFRGMLEGPNPRVGGYYDAAKGRYVRAPGTPPISMMQWKLYQETGRIGTPYWVVQGDYGGNRYRFTQTERLIARRKLGQNDVEPPYPGELPYAPVDNRVFQKLSNLDRLRQDELAVGFAYLNAVELDREDEVALQQAEEGIWKWLETQVDERLRALPHGAVERLAGITPSPRIFT